MSDSDEELLSNRVFTFPNDGSTIASFKGPDVNVRNRKFHSSFALPRTLEPPRYAESYYERQRNMRDLSPMSVASACDARFRAFNNSYYPRAMSSQMSVYNGRSGSPMSTRTCDTNTTFTAQDIIMAVQNRQFNKMDISEIKEAINRMEKGRCRRRIEKRRKRRMFLKRSKRLSYDSGEQASLSSSSDDNRSTRTTGFRRNFSSCRSTKTDISGYRTTIQESNIYKDCTDNFRQNSSRNFFNRPALNSTLMSINSERNTYKSQELRNKSVFVFGNQSNFQTQNGRLQTQNERFQTQNERFQTQNERFQTQKQRFKNGFLLPSQRFDKSIATSTIQETHRHVEDTDSDDNIFSVNNNKEKTLPNRKRSIDEDNDLLQDNKRRRVVSPCKNSTEARRAKEINNTNKLNKSNDFVFAKPSLPIKKTIKEKIISHSAPPLSDIEVSEKETNKEITKDSEEISHNITQSSDVSMRPSFIKRKLFTQKLDVAENKNVSTDNLTSNSPQGSIYGAIQKEKHKARKLVANQSCLNREIQDDNNLLDLIHKIVPPSSMNITTQSNKTEIQITKNKSNDNKWDVSSIISMKNIEDNCSDTFTDEDIFNGDNNNTVKEVHSEKKSNAQKNNKKASNLEKVPSKEKILVSEKVSIKEKHPTSNEVASNKNQTISDKMKSKDKLPNPEKVTAKGKVPLYNKVTSTDVLPTSEKVYKDNLPVPEKPVPVFAKAGPVSALKSYEKTCKVTIQKMPIENLNGPISKNCIQSFWDTDFETDVECVPIKRHNFRENHIDLTRSKEKVTPHLQEATANSTKPAAVMNASTISVADTTRRFNTTDFKVRSNRSLKPKKCCDDNKENTLNSYFDHLNRKQKPNGNKKIDDSIVTQKNNDTMKKQTVTKILKTPPKNENDNKKLDDKNETQKNNTNITKKPTKILKTPPKAKQNKVNIEVEYTNKKESPKKQEVAKLQAKIKETIKAQSKKQETDKTKNKDTQNKKKETATAKKSESKPLKDTKTPPKNTQKENDAPKTRDNSKNKRIQKIILENSYLTSNSTLESDNSKITRPLRSSRLNSSADSSKSSFNLTMTLRPRKTSSKVDCINLSSSPMSGRRKNSKNRR